ncbi:hypothetical protein J437_LFUL003446 [Ladona fulva]|uniref:Cytochrome P450 n=1 Tax=Ladona fulva TaxID=123851 RepID=A0A8K0K2L7_LADFU|nr:hypothetical protein J437_LFUL003446 [Ladona fulva]
MEEHFPQAKFFIPERWLKYRPEASANLVGSIQDYDNTKSRETNPFVFLPFGFGPRMCIGRRYSELELTVLAAKQLKDSPRDENKENSNKIIRNKIAAMIKKYLRSS